MMVDKPFKKMVDKPIKMMVDSPRLVERTDQWRSIKGWGAADGCKKRMLLMVSVNGCRLEVD